MRRGLPSSKPKWSVGVFYAEPYGSRTEAKEIQGFTRVKQIVNLFYLFPKRPSEKFFEIAWLDFPAHYLFR